MRSTYFQRVICETPTRLWVNNPTGEELEKAISTGAINATTNPSYCSSLIKREPEYIHSIIDEVIKKTDDDIAADLVVQRCTSRIMDGFLPVYEQSAGVNGYVTIQDDPRKDDDADAIVNATLRHSRLGRNYMAKIPVIEAGIESIEELIEREIPICATEIFSISQAVHICELHRKLAGRTGKHPPFYVTHITGIFDQYLKGVVEQERISIAPDVLHLAGCALARKQYRILKERGYEVKMLGGGARGTQHFTEFVGGDMHVTLNWTTIGEIVERDGPATCRMDAQTPPDVTEELCEKLPDFRRAYRDDGLPVEEFKNFGPVQLFRSMFVQGYSHLLSEIAERREMLDA